jgi:hypothetical protein
MCFPFRSAATVTNEEKATNAQAEKEHQEADDGQDDDQDEIVGWAAASCCGGAAWCHRHSGDWEPGSAEDLGWVEEEEFIAWWHSGMATLADGFDDCRRCGC